MRSRGGTLVVDASKMANKQHCITLDSDDFGWYLFRNNEKPPPKPEWGDQYCGDGCCTYPTWEIAEEAYERDVEAWEEKCASISVFKKCEVCSNDAEVFVEEPAWGKFFCNKCYVRDLRDRDEMPRRSMVSSMMRTMTSSNL